MTLLPSLAAALVLFGAADAEPVAAAEAIEDPSGVALDGFFAALARTEAATPGALTRVMHLGDSSIGLDGLPHALRRRMQARFGDGGAGFVFLDRESGNYENRAVMLTASGWDICYVAYHCEPSGRYGYGGHVFRGREGARTRVRTRRSGKWGRTVSRMELWYQADPRGGPLHVRVDAEPWTTIDTVAEQPEARWHAVEVTPGAHSFDVKHGGRGRPRAYGVVLETDGPGVVWDTLSMIGAFTKRLMFFDGEHLREQVDHRAPDLLVFGFGGNDLRRFVTTQVGRDGFVAEMRGVLAHVRAGRPELSCLVVGIVDHARAGRYEVARRHVTNMVDAQREAALAEGCAFFDAVAAMGGPGSIRTWRRFSPPLAEPDLQHLSMLGRDRLGEMIFDGLMRRYEAWARPAGLGAG
jgi:lysophospholipase L1-like esterase